MSRSGKGPTSATVARSKFNLFLPSGHCCAVQLHPTLTLLSSFLVINGSHTQNQRQEEEARGKGPWAERNCGEIVFSAKAFEFGKRATRGKTAAPTSAASAPTSVNADVHLTKGMHISYRYSLLMPVVPKANIHHPAHILRPTYQCQHPPRGHHFLPVFCLEQKKTTTTEDDLWDSEREYFRECLNNAFSNMFKALDSLSFALQTQA